MPYSVFARLSKLTSILAGVMVAIAYLQVPPTGHRFNWWLLTFDGAHWLRLVATYAAIPLFALSVFSSGFAWSGFVLWAGLGFVAAADQSPFALIAWFVGGIFLVLGLKLLKAKRRISAGSAPDQHAPMPGAAEGGVAEGAAYDSRTPRIRLEDISGMANLKEHLVDCMSMWQSGKGNGLLLYGPPGNGKTSMAEAVAGSLGLPIIAVSIADLGSKWLGESTQELKRVMRAARDQAPCVLFLDEVDSVLGSRDTSDSHQDRRDLTNAFLAEVSITQAHGVLVVAATNFIDKLDAAAIRDGRFDWRVEVPAPDLEARIGLAQSSIMKHAPKLAIDEVVLRLAATRWAGFSASRVIGICKRIPEVAGDSQRLTHDHLYGALRLLQGAQGSVPLAGDLILQDLEEATRLKARALARRLKVGAAGVNAGSTFPHGVITVAASPAKGRAALAAIARHAGYFWLDLSVTDFERSDALATKINRAKDMRPCAVFIEGASDVLGADQYSRYRACLLALIAAIDGVARECIDVTFMATLGSATGLDRLVRQEGRFADLLDLGSSAELDIEAFAEQYASSRSWRIDAGANSLLARRTDLTEEQVACWVQEAINLAVGAEDIALQSRVISTGLLEAAAQTAGFAP